jgi:hypothetical protein
MCSCFFFLNNRNSLYNEQFLGEYQSLNMFLLFLYIYLLSWTLTNATLELSYGFIEV